MCVLRVHGVCALSRAWGVSPLPEVIVYLATQLIKGRLVRPRRIVLVQTGVQLRTCLTYTLFGLHTRGSDIPFHGHRSTRSLHATVLHTRTHRHIHTHADKHAHTTHAQHTTHTHTRTYTRTTHADTHAEARTLLSPRSKCSNLSSSKMPTGMGPISSLSAVDTR